MKKYFVLFAIFISVLQAYAAEPQTKTVIEKKELDRKPAAEHVEGYLAKIIGRMQYASLLKVIDPETKVVCYMAAQSSFDGGTALQCFKY